MNYLRKYLDNKRAVPVMALVTADQLNRPEIVAAVLDAVEVVTIT